MLTWEVCLTRETLKLNNYDTFVNLQIYYDIVQTNEYFKKIPNNDNNQGNSP